MRFIHLADLHLGKSVCGFSMTEQQGYFIDAVLKYSKENSIDAIVVAGDIYDKAVPSEEAVNLFDSFIRKAVDMGIYLYMSSGNHDSHDRLNFATSSLLKNHVYMSARFDGKMKKYWYRDDYGKVNFYLLPYVKASRVRHFFPDEKIETYEDAVRVVINDAGINPDERNVILSHQYVVSPERDLEIAGSEVVNNDTVGTIERISSGTYDDFDYVALGHIHSPQEVGRKEVRYSGSPLKYSLREVNHRKSISVVTLSEKGSVDIKTVSIKPRKDMRHIQGTLKDLTANATDTDDFIYATLTDETPIPDAMSIMRSYYPFMMHMDYLKDKEEVDTEADFKNPFEKRPFREIMEEFYTYILGSDMSDEEWKIVEELAGKAGIEL